jgi:hypothetical protein
VQSCHVHCRAFGGIPGLPTRCDNSKCLDIVPRGTKITLVENCLASGTLELGMKGWAGFSWIGTMVTLKFFISINCIISFYCDIYNMHIMYFDQVHSTYISLYQPPSSFLTVSGCFGVLFSCLYIMYFCNIHPPLTFSFPSSSTPQKSPFTMMPYYFFKVLDSTYVQKHVIFVFLSLAYLS